MTKENLYTLLDLYKKAIKDKLTISEFYNSIQKARIELDNSFVKDGKNDCDLEEYINELLELQKVIN